MGFKYSLAGGPRNGCRQRALLLPKDGTWQLSEVHVLPAAMIRQAFDETPDAEIATQRHADARRHHRSQAVSRDGIHPLALSPSAGHCVEDRAGKAMKDRNRNIAVLAIVLGTAALLVALGVR
jgi:hypothetical protein